MAGHKLGALKGVGGIPPFQCIPALFRPHATVQVVSFYHVTFESIPMCCGLCGCCSPTKGMDDDNDVPQLGWVERFFANHFSPAIVRARYGIFVVCPPLQTQGRVWRARAEVAGTRVWAGARSGWPTKGARQTNPLHPPLLYYPRLRCLDSTVGLNAARHALSKLPSKAP